MKYIIYNLFPRLPSQISTQDIIDSKKMVLLLDY